MQALSILDLAPIAEGSTATAALHNARDLAQHAERWGYGRYWLAEHHNMIGIASAATAVVIGHVAAGTTGIRVGAGGIMLPNHSPLVIAEQFGTLATLFPGRIDLGLGRAPGTDGRTLRALRRDFASAESFPQDVVELQALFGPVQSAEAIQAVPGAGLEVPLWILGSSLFGAQLAAMLGLPYAFASHFAPAALSSALATYRRGFKASRQLDCPYAMVGVNVVVGETDEEAQYLFTSIQQRFANMLRGLRGKLPPPVRSTKGLWADSEGEQMASMLACSFVGCAATVQRGLQAFLAGTGADELMVATAIHDHSARLRSYEMLADLARGLAPAKPQPERCGCGHPC